MRECCLQLFPGISTRSMSASARDSLELCGKSFSLVRFEGQSVAIQLPLDQSGDLPEIVFRRHGIKSTTKGKAQGPRDPRAVFPARILEARRPCEYLSHIASI